MTATGTSGEDIPDDVTMDVGEPPLQPIEIE